MMNVNSDRKAEIITDLRGDNLYNTVSNQDSSLIIMID